MAIPALHNPKQMSTSLPYSNENGSSSVKPNVGDTAKSTKTFNKAVNQKGNSVVPIQANSNQPVKQVEQINSEDLSERDYFIQLIMLNKGTSEDVAASEYDFFC